ncbi:unnamed protein product [Dovyalis caffra]|uniref:Uncharacterized protein n=1 Tax=Dovyalis caffra TaxID=77055 RepID=A0AAV1QYB0_9ROSI|nr:unnamed protein product [Dovyalis caffra]
MIFPTLANPEPNHLNDVLFILGGDGLVSEGMVYIGEEDHKNGKTVAEKSIRELKDFAQSYPQFCQEIKTGSRSADNDRYLCLSLSPITGNLVSS